MATACYVPQYLTASYKGVSFDATTAESTHGRRGAEGEFPFSEVTAYADMGRKIRIYRLDVRFVENTHIDDANALIAALESPGPGILSHPTRGELRAAFRTGTFKDDILEGKGITTASLEFVEANSWFTGGFAFGSSLFGIDISGIVASIGDLFQESYNSTDVPFYARNDARQAIRLTAVELREQLTVAAGLTTNADVWRMARSLDQASRDVAVLDDPAEAWAVIEGGLAAINIYGTDADAKYNAFRNVANFVTEMPMPSRFALANQEMVVAMARVAATVHLARAAMELPTTTFSEALENYDRVVVALQEEIDIAIAACNSCLHIALDKFKVEAEAALLDLVYKAPPVVTYKFGYGMSSLQAAHQIYGCADRFLDIERYNAGGFPWAMGPEIVAPVGTI